MEAAARLHESGSGPSSGAACGGTQARLGSAAGCFAAPPGSQLDRIVWESGIGLLVAAVRSRPSSARALVSPPLRNGRRSGLRAADDPNLNRAVERLRLPRRARQGSQLRWEACLFFVGGVRNWLSAARWQMPSGSTSLRHAGAGDAFEAKVDGVIAAWPLRCTRPGD